MNKCVQLRGETPREAWSAGWKSNLCPQGTNAGNLPSDTEVA